MTLQEMYEIIKAAEDNHECMVNMPVIGIRFDDRKPEVGDICNYSKHNIDREDERSMPKYGTEEYEEMFELDGTSSYGVTHMLNEIKGYLACREEGAAAKSVYSVYNHCYIIGGRYTTNESDALDHGERVIAEATVLEVIY